MIFNPLFNDILIIVSGLLTVKESVILLKILLTKNQNPYSRTENVFFWEEPMNKLFNNIIGEYGNKVWCWRAST